MSTIRTPPSKVPVTIAAGGVELPALVAPLVAARPGVLLVAPTELGEAVMVELARLSLHHRRAAPEQLRIELVEPDVGDRSPGCPCCRDRLDLIEAILVHVRRRERPSHIVIAVPEHGEGDESAQGSGRSSVTTVAHTVLSDPDLRRHVRLDGVVTSVDAVAMVTRLRTGIPIGGRAAHERLAVADRLVVGRAAQVADDAFAELVGALRGLNRIAPVLAPEVATVRPSHLMGIDAWHGAPTVSPIDGSDAGHRATANGATERASDAVMSPGAEVPSTVVLEQRGTLDPGGVEAWLDGVIRQHAPRLHRLQGALAVADQPHRMCCHGVGSYAMSHPEHEDRRDRRTGSSLVVLIGEGLPVGELADEFARTVVR